MGIGTKEFKSHANKSRDGFKLVFMKMWRLKTALSKAHFWEYVTENWRIESSSFLYVFLSN